MKALKRAIKNWSVGDLVREYRYQIGSGSLCFDVEPVEEQTFALLRAGVRVVSFEPDVTAISRLVQRCESYPNWLLVPARLSDGFGIDERKAEYVSRGFGFFGDGWWPRVVVDVPWSEAVRRFGNPVAVMGDCLGIPEEFSSVSERLRLRAV